MSRPQESKNLQAMPWAVILMVATLALISAWLVFQEKWAPWLAFLTVAASAAGVALVLLAAILLLSSPEARSENWRVFVTTFRSDLDIILKYFRIRKRL
ncbi:MAG: hypothetical protein ABIG70_09800 [Pseudomonadota bacterium]